VRFKRDGRRVRRFLATFSDQCIDNLLQGVLRWNFHPSPFVRVLFRNGRGWRRKNHSTCLLQLIIITEKNCSSSRIGERKQEKISSKRRITYESAPRKSNKVEGGSLEVDCSCGTSFSLDEHEKVEYSRRFLFLSTLWTTNSAGGGERVESLPSREPSAPSPSRFSKASGGFKAVEFVFEERTS
jgi:hypothetical protein